MLSISLLEINIQQLCIAVKILKDFIFSTKQRPFLMECLFSHSVQRITYLTTFFINGTRIPAKNSGSSGGWCSLGSTIGIRAVFTFRGNPGKEGQSLSPCSTQIPEAGQRSGDASRAYIRGADLEQWPAYPPKRSGLSGSVPSDPKAGGPMLSVTGINRF